LRGIETLRAIRAHAAELPVVMTRMHPEIPYATQAVRAGASGYVCKQNAGAQLANAVRAAVASHAHVCPTSDLLLDAAGRSDARACLKPRWGAAAMRCAKR
jgi:DNA-binding NarL/FixJ family response regulator